MKSVKLLLTGAVLDKFVAGARHTFARVGFGEIEIGLAFDEFHIVPPRFDTVILARNATNHTLRFQNEKSSAQRWLMVR